MRWKLFSWKFPSEIRWRLGVAILLLFVAGATGSSEVNGRKIDWLHSVTQLCGTFENAPDGMTPEGAPVRLTDFVFPRVREARAANRIRAVRIAERTLRCTALRDDATLAERDLVEGRDFAIEEGAIGLSSRLSDSGSTGTESLALAVGTKSFQLTVSDHRDLMLIESSHGGALVFLVIPVGFSGTSGLLFRRLADPPGAVP